MSKLRVRSYFVSIRIPNSEPNNMQFYAAIAAIDAKDLIRQILNPQSFT